MAEPAWQEILRARLQERNAKESAFSSVIEQYRRLAQQTKFLKERNVQFLRAAQSVRGNNPSSSTVFVPGTSEENPVLSAYQSLRDEIAGAYKSQTQNTQRLLAMTETLREKEEASRIGDENLRKTRDELAVLRRKVDQHNELMAEKDRTVQILHDEISTLQLELGQIEERNQTLIKDNAKLLQRWLDAKQAEANKMNEANEFYENMRSRHQNVTTWRDETLGAGTPAAVSNGADSSSQPSESGNGDLNEETKETETKDGILSPTEKNMDPSPNG
ncbi:ATG16-domain-containing protein [Desarmillaria tabescens]|uniref:ATG16-domain-containing protein n=1 Tax=Armillaria tabescens TaxID=1929756 RepID=A0AA39NGZ7_ARMTA|nr:ATG16-domain-containing protein [Desarmillaria tabescens]KAK0465349.1 ATG16-domain-containing protein [Desarmillaria tabescens]